MEELDFIHRSEYGDVIKELAASGKLPKSYRSAVESALKFVYRPKEEYALALYEEYKSCIPDIPGAIRELMDEEILNELVSKKKLSAASRDNLIRELSGAKLYHGRSAWEVKHDEEERVYQEASRAFDERLRAHKEEMRRINEATKYDSLIAYGGLSAVVVILLFLFVSWVGNQSVAHKSSSEKVIPGLGVSQKEYQRRLNCFQNGC